MRPANLFIAGVLLLGCEVVHAEQLATTCHASSSYDITIEPQQLVFDRAAPAPPRVVLRQGRLLTDGQEVALNQEDQDRVTLFEQNVRVLEPQVKQVVAHGIELTAQSVREQTASLNLDADTHAQLEQRLAAHVSDLHQRLRDSQSTHDWHGDNADAYANQIVSDIAPLVASALGQQAVNAAVNGDLQAAADLRDRAGSLASDFQPRLRQRLQALAPDIRTLCPAIQQLSALQEGLRASNGHLLNLVQVEQSTPQ